MAGGRPTDYKPEYCDRVIELGKEGASIVEMACEIGVDRKTLEKIWPEAHEEFFQAFTHARQWSQVWWERKGRENLITTAGTTFQASAWSRSMAARFPDDWREKSSHELTGANGEPIKSECTMLVEFVKPAAKIDENPIT